MSLLFSFSSLYGQEKKNIIIYGINFPPLSAPELSGYGLLPQAVSESLKEKNYNIKYKFLPMARLISNLKNEKIKIAFINKLEVDTDKYYMKILHNSKVVFFYKKSKFPKKLNFSDLSEVAKYRLGVVRGAPTIDSFKKAGIIIELATDETNNFKKLQAERVDLVSTVDSFGWYTLKKIKENLKDFAVTNLTFDTDTVIAISKSTSDGIQIFKDISEGYETIKRNGKLIRIFETYFGKGNVPINSIP